MGTQLSIKTLNAIGASLLDAVAFGRQDFTIGFPLIGIEDGTFAIVRWKALP